MARSNNPQKAQIAMEKAVDEYRKAHLAPGGSSDTGRYAAPNVPAYQRLQEEAAKVREEATKAGVKLPPWMGPAAMAIPAAGAGLFGLSQLGFGFRPRSRRKTRTEDEEE
jgi:hypothetical protein